MSRAPYTLPRTLRRRFRFVRNLSFGGQSAVHLVRTGGRGGAAGLGRVVVLKLYHEGLTPDREVLAKLAATRSDHLIRILEFGFLEAEGRWYEIQEHVPGGTLTQLFQAAAGPMSEDLVRAILLQLAAALAEAHGAPLRLVHRDVKPDNVLVRTPQPVALVLADFGAASDLGARTHRHTGIERTPAYAAPEASQGLVSFASDWWSLGMVLVELLTGRHPFADETGELLPQSEISNRLAHGRPDDLVAGVPVAWRDLCRGLLRGRPENRWGVEQVMLWLEGGAPEVADETRGPFDYPPFEFTATGQQFWTRRDIARAFAANWAGGLESIGRNRLTDWVRDDLVDPVLLARLTDINLGIEDQHLRLFHTIIALDPEVTPSFRGWPLTPRGLSALASAAANADPEDEADPATLSLQSLYDERLLAVFGQGALSAWHADLDQAWREQMRRYEIAARQAPIQARAVLSQFLPLASGAALAACVEGPAAGPAGGEDPLAAFRDPLYRDCSWFHTLVGRAAALPALRPILPRLEPLARESLLRVQEQRQSEGMQQAVSFLVLIVALIAVLAGGKYALSALKEERRLAAIVRQVSFSIPRTGGRSSTASVRRPAILPGGPAPVRIDAPFQGANPLRDNLVILHQPQGGKSTVRCEAALPGRSGRVTCTTPDLAIGRHLFWVEADGNRTGPYILIVTR